MKTKLKITAIFLLGILFTATGCRKYEDGPALSLLPATERLSNTWRVFSCTQNSTDITSFYVNSNYIESYDPQGNYAYSSSFGSGSGKWIWSDDKTRISRYGTDNQASRELIVLRLKEKEFWFYYMDGNDRVEFHMVPY